MSMDASIGPALLLVARNGSGSGRGESNARGGGADTSPLLRSAAAANKSVSQILRRIVRRRARSGRGAREGGANVQIFCSPRLGY